ncbi:zinc ribbon domain-containing protein [bacterium]|nr:MAG: zinc ribbon domain-containing protein [bacterium]
MRADVQNHGEMPIYEYEPDDRDCFMCEGKIAVIQSFEDEALKLCPWCGMEVKRMISNVSFRVDKGHDPASRGFSTFKKAGNGVWEKVEGEKGPDVIYKPE